MRPLRLEVRAFGPFRGREVVDFGALPDPLFLITGPIGAGKTTILDALCFALYGESSGEGRDAGDLRSHHADPSEPTEVALEFSVGEASYRVVRKPEQSLKKKRGAGTTTVKAEAELWDRSGATGDDAGKLLASKVRDVDERVRAILGFDAAQFRQVILLPQGRFREFLSAGSKERESILRTLFDVRRCEELEERLKGAVREFEETRRAGEAARRERLGEFASRAELERGVGEKAAEEAAAEGLRRELEAAAARAAAAVAEGRRVEALFAALAAAQRALAELETRSRDMAALGAELAAAERAAPVLPDVEALDTLRDEIAAMERDLREKEQERLAYAQAGERNERRIAEHREGEAGHERNIAEVGRLEGLRERVGELERAQQAAAAAEAARATLAAECAAAEAAQRDLEGRTALLEGRLPALRANAAERPALEARLQDLRRLQQGLGACARARAEEQAARESLAGAREAQAAAQAARLSAERVAEAVRVRWVRSQAAALAGRLVAGEPCPVCGSTSHPAPVGPTGEAATQEDLEAAESARERAAGREKAAEGAASAAALRVAENAARLEALRLALGGSDERDPAELEGLIAGAAAEGAAAARAADRVAALDDELAGLRELARAAAEAARARAGRLQQAAGDGATAAANVRHLEGVVPPDLRPSGALDERLRAVGGQVAAWRRRLQELEGERSRITDSLGRVSGYVTATAAELEGKRQRFGQAGAALGAKLAAAGFADAAACREASRSDAQVAAARARLDAFNNTLQQAHGAVAEARRAVAGLGRADLAPLEEARAAAERRLQGCVHDCGRLQEQRRSLARRLGELDALEREEADAAARNEALLEIAAAAAGENQRRMKFSTYALAAWFDEVMTHTNRRLAVMSSGRYALARAAAAAGGGFKGLDLEVHDAHTGRSRPADTLSGGEGFLASLALALGLADAVQAAAGGYKLESVFVDEGFGSLDAESLELAQRCIADLQRAGRMVGLISHVEEMASWTPARIVIEKSPRGSTIRA